MIDSTTAMLFQANKDFYQKQSLWSKANLTCIRYTDSVRRTMFNTALAQRLVLNRPQHPIIFTNWENAYGDKSTYIKRVTSNRIEVMRKIRKFDDIPLETTPEQPYLLIVYDEDKNECDVVTRSAVENMPEKYGFRYDNTFIDQLQEGDMVEKGELLYSPTCYDKYGNYGYGRNVNAMYIISAHTYEDEFMATKQLCEDMTSTEVDVPTVLLNENDVLLNIMGENGTYQSFPNIGESIKNRRLCVRQTISRNRIPYYMRTTSLKKTSDESRPFFVSGDVVDVDIYCNRPREELRKTNYNEQVLWYLEMTDRYHQNVVDAIDELRAAGYKMSYDAQMIYRRFSKLLDPKTYKIKGDNKAVFDYIYMKFTVARSQGLYRGQKLAGRMGNKGVVGTIMEDYETFWLDDGTRIDLCIDALGVPNRLNTFQLFEQAITFRGRRVLQRIQELETFKEKEEMLFKFVEIFSPYTTELFKADYYEHCITDEEKQAYFEVAYENGIAINVPPFWMDKSLYDALCECDKAFPWIEPHRVFYYDPITGEMEETILKSFCGQVYIFKLKQTSKKGFSARGTGYVNKRGLPEKSDDAKKFIVEHSKNAVKMGTQERLTNLCTTSAEEIQHEMMIHRSAPVARTEFAKRELTTPGGVTDFVLTKEMTNRDADIVYAKTLSMGYELEFEENRIDMSDKPGLKHHLYQGKHYFATTEEMIHRISVDTAKELMEERVGAGPIFIGETNDYYQFLDELTDKLAQGHYLHYIR